MSKAPTGTSTGRSSHGPSGYGTVFKVNPAGTLTTLYSFTGCTDGGNPSGLAVVTIGGIPATVQFAGLISRGVFQFNVIVAASTPAGDNTLTATYGSLTTQSGELVTVGP